LDGGIAGFLPARLRPGLVQLCSGCYAFLVLRRRPIALLALGLLGLAVLSLAAACDGGGGDSGGDSPTPSASPDPSAVESPSPGSTTVAGETPPPISTAVVVGRLPDGFPEDFPIFAEAEILRSATVDDRYLSGLTTSVDRDEVVAYYEEALAGSRWEVTSRDETTLKDTVFLIIRDTEGGGEGSVSIATLDNATNIVLSVPK